MQAILRLFNIYFWKTIYGPVLSFVFPPILLIILGNVLRLEYVFPGIISLISVFIAVQALPLGLMEMKKSTLFSYIGASPIKTRLFTFSVILYYVMIIFASILILLLVGIIFFYNKVFPFSMGIYSGIFTVVGFFSFLFANLIHIFLALSIGIAISSLSKTPQQALTVSLIIIIPSMFLSGMVISVDIIAKSQAMKTISMFIPFRYTTGNIVIASTPKPQLGEILDKMNWEEMKMIFSEKKANDFDFVAKKFTHKNKNGISEYVNIESVIKTFKYMENRFNNGEKDSFEAWQFFKNDWFNSGEPILFRKIFLSNNGNLPPSSDNNIFNWTESFGVRRVPGINDIMNFVSEYLGGEDKKGGATERLIKIYIQYIQKGNYSWLNIFLNQNIILYENYDRVLNVIIPILLSFSLFFMINKKFNFSSR